MTSNGNGNSSFYSSTNSSTSTLRPRNTLSRLISYEDGSSPAEAVGASTSGTSTPPHCKVSTAATAAQSESQTQDFRTHGRAHKRNASENESRRASSGIWESWSSFGGIASGFLGSNGAGQSVRRVGNQGKPKSTRTVQDRSYGLRQSQAEWGPKSDTHKKPTSIEDHQALLQTKKREALLLQSAQAGAGKDVLGRYKRKDSDASISWSPVDNPNDGDILVYRHKVQPNDTMAGVVIKYSCQPEAFRKVNRFWPNDNIQRRDYVVLPVDACSIRGRKTEAPYVADLQDSNIPLNNSPQAAQGGKDIPVSSLGRAEGSTEPFPQAEIPSPNVEPDSDYRHDSWVNVPSHSQPIEVLRISKRALGYFPPARRKSITSIPAASSRSTPKTSFDMLRHPPTHAAQQAQLNQHLQSLSLNSSPVRNMSIPRFLTDTSRTRSSSTVSTTTETAKANAFLSALSGPGGVGALRGNRADRAKPGPADDPLNKKFAQYVPDLLPPDHPDYQKQGSSLRPPHSQRTSSSLRATPRASIDSIRSTRSNSSSIPNALSWVGKVGSPMRKKAEAHRVEGMTLSLGVLGEAPGDLIELADTPDEVSRQLHDAVQADGADERTPTVTPRHDELDERFPVRGRMMWAYDVG